MKGITPVIAVILLLLITISLVGFAFVWFSKMTQQTTSSIGTQVQTQTDNTGKRVIIDTATAGTPGHIYIRSLGTQPIDMLNEVGIYVNGVKRDQTSGNAATGCTPAWTAGNIAVSATVSCNTNCNAGDMVKVIVPGSTDQVVCS